jgi:hypothetical protein
LKTNKFPKPKDSVLEKVYKKGGIFAEKGQEIGFFHMGSTVVLIFQCPEFEFELRPGQQIKLGQMLGVVRKTKTVNKVPQMHDNVPKKINIDKKKPTK